MNYAAVNTKASAVYAKYLKPQLPLEILEAGNYREGIDLIEREWQIALPKDAPLLEVNIKMEEKVYEILQSFGHFLQGAPRYFFRSMEHRYEIQDIKRVFRAVYNEEDLELVRNTLLYLNPELFPRNEDLKIDDLFTIFEHTPYGRMLSAYRGEESDRMMFYIQMGLDQFYYENLAEEASHLEKKDRKAVMEVLGRHIDLLNIFYIYRAKKNYDLMDSELANFVIRGGNIPKALLREWIRSDGVESLKEAVRHSSFAFLFKKGRDNYLTDVLAARDLSKRYSMYYQKETGSIGRIVDLYLLLELEVHDVSTVLEGLRLGFRKDMIRDLLTIPAKEGELWQ